MTTSVTFDRTMIAPCGMNCGTCIAFLRDKNKCYGCRIPFEDKSIARQNCIIKNYVNLENTTSKFCYDCEKFPCQRLKNLDKRYRTKYRTSFIQNLKIIKEKGISSFLANETTRWSCPNCGSTLSCHRDNCLNCNLIINKNSVS
jgi:ribosomal protein S27AE